MSEDNIATATVDEPTDTTTAPPSEETASDAAPDTASDAGAVSDPSIAPAVDAGTAADTGTVADAGTEGSEAVESSGAADSAEAGAAESAEAGAVESAEAGAADSAEAADGDDETSELDTEAEVAADFLEELLDIADLDGDIDTYTENGRAQVSIVTDSQVLVGKDGQVLEALQEIVRLAVMAETDNRTRLMLDVAGFREKRRASLRALAADAVQEVRDTGESVRLSPMNPFERKIVHDAVAEAGLVSESEGTEPQRRVVVQPAT